jgi:DNA polymerase alpha-associated DNA helicase A
MDRTLAHLKRIVAPEDSGPSANAPNLNLINCLLGVQLPAWRKAIPPTLAQLAEAESQGTSSASGSTSGNKVDWFGEGLNDSQKEAVEFCLMAENVACIHGPPGVSSALPCF